MHYKRESILRALADIQAAILNLPDWGFSGPQPQPEPTTLGDLHLRAESPGEFKSLFTEVQRRVAKRKPRADKGKPRGKRKAKPARKVKS